MHTRAFLQLTLTVLASLAFRIVALAEVEGTKPTSHSSRNIEGWTVRVDDRLLAGADAAKGERALKLLTARLLEIELIVPEQPLARLRETPIQLDLQHGNLHSAQYHPSAEWLKANGYDENLAKCVHIPEVDNFLSAYEIHRQPCMILHELAHSYHDRVLGFEEPRIAAAWEAFRDSGKYKSVLTIKGTPREHYGLTNAKEFFAEMTETYFGTNDFYPFVAGELQRDEPKLYDLLREIWGPLPKR